jgi:hypothetical protein
MFFKSTRGKNIALIPPVVRLNFSLPVNQTSLELSPSTKTEAFSSIYTFIEIWLVQIHNAERGHPTQQPGFSK